MRGGHFLNFLKPPTTAPRHPIVPRHGSVLAQVLYLCRKKCNEMELSKQGKECKEEKEGSGKYQIIGRILMDRGFETRIKPDVNKTEAQDWCDNIKTAESDESEANEPVEVIQVPVDPTTPVPITPDPSRPANTPVPNTPVPNTPVPNTPAPTKAALKKNSTVDCTLIHIPDKALKNYTFLLRSIEIYEKIIEKETKKDVKANYETRLKCLQQKLKEFHQNVTKKHI